MVCLFRTRQASSATPKFHKAASNKLKRVEHYKKSESRKQERLHFERKLQSNLDQYVTRAVTELVYRIPDDVEDAAGPEHPDTAQEEPAPVAAGQSESAQPPAVPEAMARERFPIPMEVRTPAA